MTFQSYNITTYCITKDNIENNIFTLNWTEGKNPDIYVNMYDMNWYLTNL